MILTLKKYLSPLLIFILIVSILLFDTLLELGVAFGVLYISVILIYNSIISTKNKETLYLSILTSTLVIVGYYYSPPGGELWKVITNRLLSIFCIWITAFLLIKINNQSKAKLIIQQKSDEKDTLLKEIHHRVKNNLQVITSLLSLQANAIEDTALRTTFNQSQYRINSMALVHEMLYESSDISKIKYESYLQGLMTNLVYSIKGKKNTISLDIDTNNLFVNLDTAIPLGLLINEIVTNSLKYAFDKDIPGILTINLKQTSDNTFLLKIGDDGKGFVDVDLHSLKSIGLKLINKLVRQLKGSIKKDKSKKGTNYIVEFKKLNYEN
jgi:two-component sensor histidine kinase